MSPTLAEIREDGYVLRARRAWLEAWATLKGEDREAFVRRLWAFATEKGVAREDRRAAALALEDIGRVLAA